MACPCNNKSRLQYRTPEQYLAEARKLDRVGSPWARHSYRKAALAMVTAEAARRGDRALAARGLAGLHALESAEQSQIDARLQTLGAQGQRVRAQIQAYAEVASAVAGFIAAASRDAGVRKVAAWLDYVLLGRAAPEPIRSSDLASVCNWWYGDGQMVLAGLRLGSTGGQAITSAVGGSAGQTAAQVLRVLAEVVSYIEMAMNQICALGDRVPPAPGAADPGNCATLMCNVGEEKVASSTGAGCECRPIQPATSTPIDPVVWARTQWRAAMAGRLLAEGLIKNPGTSTLKANAVRNNCAFSCRLQFFEHRYLAAKRAAGQPAVIEAYGTSAPSSATARRFVDATTAPSSCNCTPQFQDLSARYGDDGSGAPSEGVSPTLIVGGVAAAAALFFLVRR